MKDGIIRVGAVAPKIRVADVSANTDACILLAKEAAERGVGVILFPELTLTAASAADLFMQSVVYERCESALLRYAEETKDLSLVSFIGLPVRIRSKRYNAVACVSGGKILGVSAKEGVFGDERRYFSPVTDRCEREISLGGNKVPFGKDIIYQHNTIRSLSFAVEVGSDSALAVTPSRRQGISGANIVLNPIAIPAEVGLDEARALRYRSATLDLSVAYVVSEGGIGESGTDGVYKGKCSIYDRGCEVVSSRPYSEGEIVCNEIDTEALSALREKNPLVSESETAGVRTVDFFLSVSRTHLTRKIEKSPFIPDDEAALASLTEEIIEMQAHALAGRLVRSCSKGLVLGISGGLDSTLALLVAVRATDILSMPRSAVVAITMPCFGTTARTKGNAERLTEALGATLRCIDIKGAVSRHFEDIGHDAESYNVVYENAQARERTQVLMDVANSLGALVVGTGDLSELALGWATYNGDHMSMYSVNGGIPKTLMRYLVEYVARDYEKRGYDEVARVLRDVLSTPVSPELLPPKDGEIAQCTEGLVGPYELHDFFLYYFLRYGFAPRKILRLAAHAFLGEYDEETVRAWLTVFVRRFFSQQFKRSCLPDGPKVLSIGVSPRGELRMPSDAVSREWLDF